jgi:hypothetical protein
MRIIVLAVLALSLFLSAETGSSFSANKVPGKRVKLGKGTWVDCKKFHGQGKVLIKIDAKGNWLCWTGKET